VVECLTHYSEIEGSNPIARPGREINKKTDCNIIVRSLVFVSNDHKIILKSFENTLPAFFSLASL
jgi:hypothetical protein